MLREPEFKPTPREEEIDDLKAEVKELREEVERLRQRNQGAGTSRPTNHMGDSDHERETF